MATTQGSGTGSLSDVDNRRAVIWRRGLLLTGCAAGADAVLVGVQRRYADLMRVGESRLDRLTVNLAREQRLAGKSPVDALGSEGASALLKAGLALDRRVFEPWALMAVAGCELGEAVRAIGTTNDAAMRLAEQAREQLADKVEPAGGYDVAAGQLREAFTELDVVEAFGRVEQKLRSVRARRAVVLAVQVFAFLAFLGLIGWLFLDLWAWDDEQAARDAVLGSEVVQPSAEPEGAGVDEVQP